MSESISVSSLATVFETMPLGAVVAGADGCIIAANPAACSILGLAVGHLIGLSIDDPRWAVVDGAGRLLPAEQLPPWVALRSGVAVPSQLIGITDQRQGGRRWITVSATPEFLPGAAAAQRVCVLFEDVTARQAAEIAKGEAETRFQALFACSPIGIAYHRMIYDQAGKPVDYLFLAANEHYLRLTGVDPRGKLVTEAFPGIEQDPFDWIGKFGHVASTGETIRFQQHLLANDRWYDCVGYQTGPGMFVAAFLEITEQKRAEAALRASEENLRVTFASIGDAVIATDAQGRVTRMNAVAERLTGWSLAAAVGHPLPEVFRIINVQNRQPVENPVERVLSTGMIVGLANHTALIARDGSERQIADSGAPITNDAGSLIGVVLVFRDVTAEYALQEQVRQSQKMDAVGQLAGGIAHDFNNMLAGVIGAAELLQARIGVDANNARLLGMITESANRAAALTRKLLMFARKQTAGSAPVDVHVAVNDTIALLRETLDRNIRIEVELGATATQVIGDLAQLQSACLNLGINASHAMPQGGVLTFRTRIVVLEEATWQVGGTSLRPGPHLEIEVSDTGCGIPREHLPHIFEPFFTTKAPGKGTGLGLSAVLGVVQQHQGSITVCSEVGLGTCFRILLPLTATACDALPAVLPSVRGTGRILLVDDEPVLRATGTALLTSLGYDVLAAAQGEDALQVVRDSQLPIDLVILDMIMPGMGGRECFTRLRLLRPELPVIVASGFSRHEELEAIRGQGPAGFIQKPYHLSELSQLVATALGRSVPRPASG